MKKNIFIIILAILVLGLGGYLVYDKVLDKNVKEEVKEESVKQEEENKEITLESLYGTYTWEKKHITDSGNELDLKIKLVLNSDGSATYNASNGYEEEATKGSFIYENGKVIYTREYYNYSDNNGQDTDEIYSDNNSKTEIFMVIDKDTLQNTYYDQNTSLSK